VVPETSAAVAAGLHNHLNKEELRLAIDEYAFLPVMMKFN
jgi:hypothetical protein